MSVSVAALVMAYRYPEGIPPLARYCAASGVDMYVHVDRKIDIAPYRALSDGLANVRLIHERVPVYWAGFSMVRAFVALIEAARRRRRYDRFLIITEDSLPLVPPAALMEALAPDDSLVSAHPADAETQLHYDRFLMLDSKATQIQWIPVVDREVTDQDLAAFWRLGALRRRGKKPIGRIWTGSGWVGLTASAVETILESWHGDVWLRESFEFADVPEESYFHTILGMAGQLGSGRPLMHVEWTGDPPPRRFRTLAELADLAGSAALFVRKIDLSPDDLAIYVDRLIRT